MEKETTGGQWRLADGSDVPASFNWEWLGGRRGLPSIDSTAGWDFMSVYCGDNSLNFGQLQNYHIGFHFNFICQSKEFLRLNERVETLLSQFKINCSL